MARRRPPAKSAQAPPEPTTPATTPTGSAATCPTCKSTAADFLRQDRRAGHTFSRFRCLECHRIYVLRGP